jgi:hypothetical protein
LFSFLIKGVFFALSKEGRGGEVVEVVYNFFLVRGICFLGNKGLFERMDFFFSHSSNGDFLRKQIIKK